jgi:hypothetical protein
MYSVLSVGQNRVSIFRLVGGGSNFDFFYNQKQFFTIADSVYVGYIIVNPKNYIFYLLEHIHFKKSN